MSQPILGIYVAYGQRRGKAALHWIILARPDGGMACTYYHVTGGPTQGTPYKIEIQDSKRFDSNGIASTHLVGNIKASDRNKLKASCKNFQPMFCQRWVVEVLGDMERKGLLPSGTYTTWHSNMEVDPYSNNGAQPPTAATTIVATKAQTQTADAQSSAASESSTAQQSTGKWVWDEEHKRYRYLDPTTNRWVWAIDTASAAPTSTSTNTATAAPNWIWDEDYKKYRYWDSVKNVWIWQ